MTTQANINCVKKPNNSAGKKFISATIPSFDFIFLALPWISESYVLQLPENKK